MTNAERIKELAPHLNVFEVLKEANNIGKLKRPKVVFKYTSVYSTLNRISTKEIHPILEEAIETVAKNKADALTRYFSQKK